MSTFVFNSGCSLLVLNTCTTVYEQRQKRVIAEIKTHVIIAPNSPEISAKHEKFVVKMHNRSHAVLL